MTNSTTSKLLTDDTLTNARIRLLRDEAGAANDPITVELCEIALSGEDSDGSGTTLGKPCTVEQARASILNVINYAIGEAE